MNYQIHKDENLNNLVITETLIEPLRPFLLAGLGNSGQNIPDATFTKLNFSALDPGSTLTGFNTQTNQWTCHLWNNSFSSLWCTWWW